MRDKFTRGISCRVSAVIIEQDRLLLARFSHQSRWRYVLLGGHLEPGETIFECVKREMREELGVAVEPLHLCYVLENFFLLRDRTEHELTFFVVARLSDPHATFTLEPELEVQFIDWQTELPHIVLLPEPIHRQLLRSRPDRRQDGPTSCGG